MKAFFTRRFNNCSPVNQSMEINNAFLYVQIIGWFHTESDTVKLFFFTYFISSVGSLQVKTDKEKGNHWRHRKNTECKAIDTNQSAANQDRPAVTNIHPRRIVQPVNVLEHRFPFQSIRNGLPGHRLVVGRLMGHTRADSSKATRD